MKSKQKTLAFMLSLCTAAAVLSGCSVSPSVEQQSVVALKPSIGFQFISENLANARVHVDGLLMGTAGSFKAGTSALALKAGTHQIRVDLDGKVLLDERFYVGDGVNKIFELR